MSRWVLRRHALSAGLVGAMLHSLGVSTLPQPEFRPAVTPNPLELSYTALLDNSVLVVRFRCTTGYPDLPARNNLAANEAVTFVI